MEKPTKPCWNCGSLTWWLTQDGRYLCGWCHPNPDPAPSHEIPVVREKHSPEVLALRDRVILGNKKLNDAFEQIKGIADDREQWAAGMERWHEANEKLSLLCTELKAMGYADCLYLDEKGEKIKRCLSESEEDIGCRVCPSSIRYWEKELMELP